MDDGKGIHVTIVSFHHPRRVDNEVAVQIIESISRKNDVSHSSDQPNPVVCLAAPIEQPYMGTHRLSGILESGLGRQAALKAQRIALIPMSRRSATDSQVVPGLHGVEQTHGLSMRE